MTRYSVRTLIAWSLVGLIGGHQLTYLVLYRDPATVLDATGHGWLWAAPILVFSAALTAMVLGLLGTGPVRSLRWRFAFLALIQGSTFATVEIAERSTSGMGLGHVLAEAWLVLVVGIAIQAAIAAVLAVASRVVERVAAALRRRASNARRPDRQLGRPTAAFVLPATYAGTGQSPRAPPVLA